MHVQPHTRMLKDRWRSVWSAALRPGQPLTQARVRGERAGQRGGRAPVVDGTRGRDGVASGVDRPGRGAPRRRTGQGRSGQDDARDALHLDRLLHLGEVMAVDVPDAQTSAGREPVQARQGVRCDLMSALHRPSRLLLRRGIVTPAARRGPGATTTGCAPRGAPRRRCCRRSTPQASVSPGCHAGR